MVNLNESEWRMIHNALSCYQNSFKPHDSSRTFTIRLREQIQQLMDKVRDENIAHASEQERKQGHSALQVRDGKLSKFDPHPPWKWERGAMLPQSIEELELVVNTALRAAHASEPDDARTLAMLVLQSDFYASSPEVKQATDDVLAESRAADASEPEWTVESVRGFVYRATGADLRDDTARAVAEAHNAAVHTLKQQLANVTKINQQTNDNLAVCLRATK